MKLGELLSVPGIHLRVQDDHGVCLYWAKHIDDQELVIENVKTGEVRSVHLKKMSAVSYDLMVISNRLARVLLHLREEDSTRRDSSTSPTG